MVEDYAMRELGRWVERTKKREGGSSTISGVAPDSKKGLMGKG